MTKIVNVSLAMMAISTAGCATPARTPAATNGRMIEFESGPEGFNTKTYFYEAAHEVVAFDAQFTPELAQKSIERLREFTQKPITWLVITHPNPDKFNGAGIFKAQGAKVIASEKTRDAIPTVQAYKEIYFTQLAHMFKPGEYPQPSAIDQTFRHSMSIVLKGGEKIELRDLDHPGVSSTQTVAYLPMKKALIVGDLIHHNAHAWLEGGIVDGKPVPTLDGWTQDLTDLKSLFPANTTVYGGRGDSGDLQALADEQIEYLKIANELVDQYIASLGDRRSELQGPTAQAHYTELQYVFERQFPDSKLGYMIGYGIYGLVNSKL